MVAGLDEAEGPSPERIQAALDTYVAQFDSWYAGQLKRILDDYVSIVRRINPYVRRAQYGDCTAHELAEAVVNDWDSRNFVTAGGQALEALAIAAGKDCQKAIAEGVDLQRTEPADASALHLYTVKSGAITRNTDIVNKMKQNLRKAEKLARQNPGIKNVRLNYATCIGTFRSTLADGVHRPSSPQFWSEVMELPEEKAIRLLWLITAESAKTITWVKVNRQAVIAQVAAYIAKEGSDRVDWEFVVKATNFPWKSYAEEHKKRDAAARAKGAEILALAAKAEAAGTNPA